jgi:amino acid transporter
MKALNAQGISRDSLPYKAPLQPFGSWFAVISTAIITLFKGQNSYDLRFAMLKGHCRSPGFDTFIPFTKDTFVTSYIGLPTFVLCWGGYKLYYRTSVIPSNKVDLITGKREIDEEEERFVADEEAKGPRSLRRRIWDSL